MNFTKPKFELGQIFITPGVEQKINKMHITESLNRHENGDWGDVSENDYHINEAALKNGNLLLSIFHDVGNPYYIKTHADRSLTTVMLPEEY